MQNHAYAAEIRCQNWTPPSQFNTASSSATKSSTPDFFRHQLQHQRLWHQQNHHLLGHNSGSGINETTTLIVISSVNDSTTMSIPFSIFISCPTALASPALPAPPAPTLATDIEIFRITFEMFSHTILESQRITVGHSQILGQLSHATPSEPKGDHAAADKMGKATQKLHGLIREREEVLSSLEKPSVPRFTGIAEQVRYASQLTSFQFRDFVYRAQLQQLTAVELEGYQPAKATQLVNGLKDAIKSEDHLLSDSILKVAQAEMHFSLFLSQSTNLPHTNLEALVSEFQAFCAKTNGQDGVEIFAHNFSTALSEYISGYVEEVSEDEGAGAKGKKPLRIIGDAMETS